MISQYVFFFQFAVEWKHQTQIKSHNCEDNESVSIWSRTTKNIIVNQSKFWSIKIDMLRFNGDNPHRCLFKGEQFFPCYSLLDEQWFIFVSIHMNGSALN